MTENITVKLPRGESRPAGSSKDQRTELSVEALVQSFLDNLVFVQGR